MNTHTRRTLIAIVAIVAAGALGLGGTVAFAPTTAATTAVTLTAVSTTTAGGTHSDPQEIPDIAAEWAQAWNNADPQQLAALFTDDARYTDHAFGPTFTGRDGVANWAAITGEGVTGLTVTITSAFQDDDQVAVRWTFDGHVAGAPKPFSVPVATILQLRDDKIASCDDFYNLAAVLRQSGLPADTDFGAPA